MINMNNKFKKIIFLILIINILLFYSVITFSSKENKLKEESQNLNNRILEIDKNIKEDRNTTPYLNDEEFKNDIRKSLDNLNIKNYSLQYLETIENENIIETTLALRINTDFLKLENLIKDLESLDRIYLESIELVSEGNNKLEINMILKTFSNFNHYFREEKGLINKEPFKNNLNREKNKLEIRNSNLEDKEKENIEKNENKIDEKEKKIDNLKEKVEIQEENKRIEKEVVEKIIVEKENFFRIYPIQEEILLGFINEKILEEKEYKLLEVDRIQILEKDISDFLNYKLYSSMDNFSIETKIIYILEGKIKEEIYKEEFIREDGVLKNNEYFLDISKLMDIQKIDINLILTEGDYRDYIILEDMTIRERNNEKE